MTLNAYFSLLVGVHACEEEMVPFGPGPSSWTKWNLAFFCYLHFLFFYERAQIVLVLEVGVNVVIVVQH